MKNTAQCKKNLNNPKIVLYANITFIFVVNCGMKQWFLKAHLLLWRCRCRFVCVLLQCVSSTQLSISGLQHRKANATVFTRVFQCQWLHMNLRLKNTDNSKPKEFTTTARAQTKTIPENNSYDTRYHDMTRAIQHEWGFCDYK